MTFREYVVRREASSNIFQNAGAGRGSMASDARDVVSTLGFAPAGAIAAPYAAAKGFLGTTPGKYRSMVRGNPYLSDTPERTKVLAGKAYEDSSSWLLDRVEREKVPQVRGRLITSLQQAVQELDQHFHSQQPTKITATGQMVGQQATGMSNFFALPASIIAGIKQAAKNVIDTLNPAYQNQSNEWAESVNKMVLSLDALRSVLPMELVDSYIKTFLHNLEKGWGSRAREIGRS